MNPRRENRRQILTWLLGAALLHLTPGLGRSRAATDALAVIEQHCLRCHGGEKVRGGLDLTSREALLKGGENGAVVVPGQPAQSPLYLMVTHEREPGMPYKKERLSVAEVELLRKWIEAGFPYARSFSGSAGKEPSETGFTISEEERQHWAFQPLRKPPVPELGSNAWIRNEIDAFILAGMKKEGVTPAPAASRETLLRRVTLDLIGLPPSLEEIDAFANDPSESAYERLIDRLLSSPHYGERWGRHWLDVARFAETDGFEHDAVRVNAWRYRDYVIRSFYRDKPYDRFIREQIAGDELYQGDHDALIATAFNLLGPDMVDSADQVQRRLNTLNDMTDTTAFAFLGVTLACARCHDHKFEPLSQKDYYRLQAFFTPVTFRQDAPVATREEEAAFEAAMEEYKKAAKSIQSQIDELEGPVRKELYDQKFARLSPEAQAAHLTPKEKRTTEQSNQVLETADQIKVSEAELTNALNAEQKGQRKELQTALKRIPKPAPLPATMALANGKEKKKTFILKRGDYNNPAEEVHPGFPEVLTLSAAAAAPATRADLANWIASPNNPLTARVMVNRVWRHHFGRGLVATPSDFGLRGERPTHPELLDWLAADFMAHGWRLKRLHKLILLSATYRQACAPGGDSRVLSDRLYAGWQRKRLEGEAIRDSLLAISGQLNPEMGGPGVYPPIPRDLFKGASGWAPSEKREDHRRRSLYIFARRNLRFPFLEIFDAPDSNLSCSRREESATAPQSLALLNADEVLEASRATAQRVVAQSSNSTGQIELLYRLVLGRAPTSSERQLSLNFLKESPMTELCRALFNLNAFVYVE